MSNINNTDPEMNDLLHRFEDAIKSDSLVYFDIDDLEAIIDSYIDINDLVKSREALEYAYRIHPNSIEIKCKEGKLLFCEGHYRLAIKLLSPISNLDPDYIEIIAESNMHLRHFNKARDIFNLFLTVCDTNELDEAFVYIARLYNTYEKPLMALEFLDNAIILFPENNEILVERAFAYEQIHKYDEAIEIYNKLISKDPYSEHLWCLLGYAYFIKKEFQDSIRAYDYALAINPNEVNIKVQIAHCLFNLGQYEEAVEPYKEYLEQNPYDLLVTTFLAETYENIDDIENAKILYKKVVDITDELPEAWLGLAECYRTSNNIEEAYHIIKKANKRIPDNLQLVYYLSRIESEMAELTDNETYLKHALKHILYCLKKNPENDKIIFEAGTLFLQFENYKKAKDLFELAYKINPYIENITIFMAMTYYAIGDYELCKKFYDKAKETISNAESIFLSLFPDAYKIIK